MENCNKTTLDEEVKVICDDYLCKLLYLYQCRDWGMGFVEFLEKATEVTLDTIGRWQCEHVDEDEEEE